MQLEVQMLVMCLTLWYSLDSASVVKEIKYFLVSHQWKRYIAEATLSTGNYFFSKSNVLWKKNM